MVTFIVFVLFVSQELLNKERKSLLLNGEILDVVGDLPILIRFQHDDNLSFGESVVKYMKDLPNSIEF